METGLLLFYVSIYKVVQKREIRHSKIITLTLLSFSQLIALTFIAREESKQIRAPFLVERNRPMMKQRIFEFSFSFSPKEKMHFFCLQVADEFIKRRADSEW